MSSACNSNLKTPSARCVMLEISHTCRLQDGPRRWSMGALYSVHSSRLLSHFCILERAVEVQPTDKIDFEKLPFVQARERYGPAQDILLSYCSIALSDGTHNSLHAFKQSLAIRSLVESPFPASLPACLLLPWKGLSKSVGI